MVERRGVVALLALSAESASVHVVSGVARAADHGGFPHVLRLDVALTTADLCVRARQREASALGVVELPHLPAVGCVAAAAFLSEASLVDIHLRVAIDTLVRGFLEPLRGVALAAGDGDVQSEEREAAHVVIESHVLPIGLCVALLALLAEAAAVRLIGAMATRAVDTELLHLCDARMAGVAIELRVGSFKRKVESGGVIEARYLPQVVSVAVGAGGSEPSYVPVVGLVTAVAVLRDGILEVAGAMALLTADMCVAPEQGEAGLPRVIELLRGPVGCRMAVGALGPLAAPVNVIGHMAGDALLGRPFVALTGMAGGAGHLAVFVSEGEFRFVVIEVSLPPGLRVVARSAVRAQCAPMSIVFLVAADAGGGGLAIWRVRAVATAAVERQMGAIEREAGKLVGKSSLAQLVYVGVAALVLRMAATALPRRAALHAAVVPGLVADVGCDFLVTVQTQCGLAAAVGAVVTGAAVALQLGVRLGDRSRHDQRLDAGRPGTGAERQGEKQRRRGNPGRGHGATDQ